MSKTGRVQTALERFSEPTREWFAAAFAEPTPAQEGAWEAIGAGRHALVVAPTGSGKTLAAFLWSHRPAADRSRCRRQAKRCRVLYISPLKALGGRRRAQPAGAAGRHPPHRRPARRAPSCPRSRVGVRSGDTPAAERRKLTTQPPDILITTPESLFLMLTSPGPRVAARRRDRDRRRGARRRRHQARRPPRGQPRAPRRPARDSPPSASGCRATVRPLDEVARFLGGTRPSRSWRPPPTKEWDLKVVVPVEDMTAPDGSTTRTATDADAAARGSIWPHVEEHVVDLIEQHRSTIVFANSRRLAERLTARLNEIAADARRRSSRADDRPAGRRPR